MYGFTREASLMLAARAERRAVVHKEFAFQSTVVQSAALVRAAAKLAFKVGVGCNHAHHGLALRRGQPSQRTRNRIGRATVAQPFAIRRIGQYRAAIAIARPVAHFGID